MNDFTVQEVWDQRTKNTSVVVRIGGFDHWLTHFQAGRLADALNEAAGREPNAGRLLPRVVADVPPGGIVRVDDVPGVGPQP